MPTTPGDARPCAATPILTCSSPSGTTGNALVQIERAKEVCGECPVNRACLDYALETNQDSGIWGGTSEEERRILRRRYVARQRSAMPA